MSWLRDFGEKGFQPKKVRIAINGHTKRVFRIYGSATLEFPLHRGVGRYDAQWLYYTVNSKWHNCRQFQFRRQILPLHDFVISLSDLSSQRPGILPMVF